jgi:hypothetical protein
MALALKKRQQELEDNAPLVKSAETRKPTVTTCAASFSSSPTSSLSFSLVP